MDEPSHQLEEETGDPAPKTSGGPTRQGASLVIEGLEVVYGDALSVLHGVDLSVPAGSIVALLGANGAGKTTLLRAATGLLNLHGGRIVGGSVTLDGEPIRGAKPGTIVRRGLAQVMEGRRIFAELSVEENLRTGASTAARLGGDRRELRRGADAVPQAGRAAYARSPGTSPAVSSRWWPSVERSWPPRASSSWTSPRSVWRRSSWSRSREIIVDINQRGTSVLLVEQNATMALGIAHDGYVLETGNVARHGPAAELRDDPEIREFYLGVGEAGRLSFRDVKTYRPAKSWSLR